MPIHRIRNGEIGNPESKSVLEQQRNRSPAIFATADFSAGSIPQSCAVPQSSSCPVLNERNQYSKQRFIRVRIRNLGASMSTHLSGKTTEYCCAFASGTNTQQPHCAANADIHDARRRSARPHAVCAFVLGTMHGAQRWFNGCVFSARTGVRVGEQQAWTASE